MVANMNAAGSLAALGRAERRPDEARAILAELAARSRTEYVSPLDLAVLHADLGEQDRAFALLERAYEQRVPALSRIQAATALKGLRSDARFQDLLRRMRFPDSH